MYDVLFSFDLSFFFFLDFILNFNCVFSLKAMKRALK